MFRRCTAGLVLTLKRELSFDQQFCMTPCFFLQENNSNSPLLLLLFAQGEKGDHGPPGKGERGETGPAGPKVSK